MDRLIIESIEGRITLGIVMFVSLMILIGWIMINEPYRMAEFQEQHLGRSIEVGAELLRSQAAQVVTVKMVTGVPGNGHLHSITRTCLNMTLLL